MSNQGFILIHSTTVHIKDQKRTLSYQQLKQKAYNQKLPMEWVGEKLHIQM